MKCAACEYDSDKAVENLEYARVHKLEGIVRELEEKAKPFYPVNFNYNKNAISPTQTQYTWNTLYVCPHCGAVRMEVIPHV